MTDSTQSIFKSAGRFFSGTVLSRITGMLRDISMAYVFGTQVSVASFMIAFRFAHLMRRLFGEGALQSAFIPEFEALRHQDPNRAFQFFCDLKLLLTLFLSMLILVGCGTLGLSLTYGGFKPENQEVIFLTLLMLPSLLFICLYGLNASLLQCEKHYFTSGVAPVGFNIIQICTILILYNQHSLAAMPRLAIGVIIACLFQWLITLPQTISLVKKNLTGSIIKRLNPFSPDILALFKPLALGMIGVAATQINNAVDALFGRLAEPEGPAFLWYSIRLQQLPLALFGIAIAGAILPPLARAGKAKDSMNYTHFIQYGLQKTILFMVPITFFILAIGDSGVNLVYGRGDFDFRSITGTTLCLWAYGLGLIPSALVLILAPACYAQGNYRAPALAAFLTTGLNALLNAWFIFGWGWGAASVACATSVSAWVNLAYLSKTVSQYGATFETPKQYKFVAKVTFASCVAFFGVLIANFAIGNSTLALLMQHKTPEFPKHFSEQLFTFVWQAGLFGSIFAFLAYLSDLFTIPSGIREYGIRHAAES